MILPVIGLITIFTVGVTDNYVRYQKIGDQSHCVLKRTNSSNSPGAVREFETVCKK